jgi:hypothetical protein
MKNVFFIVALLFATQIKSQLVIIRHQEEMTDKVYFFASEGMVIKSEDGESGFRISLGIKEKNSQLKDNGINIKAVNIGSCYENNKLIILFENGEKINLVSWNKFNCEGNAYFEITDPQKELLISQKVKKIRFENGRSFENLTGEATNPEYFITLFNLMSQNKYENEQP